MQITAWWGIRRESQWSRKRRSAESLCRDLSTNSLLGLAYIFPPLTKLLHIKHTQGKNSRTVISFDWIPCICPIFNLSIHRLPLRLVFLPLFRSLFPHCLLSPTLSFLQPSTGEKETREGWVKIDTIAADKSFSKVEPSSPHQYQPNRYSRINIKTRSFAPLTRNG